jgi:hypothetical protein
MPQRDKFWNRLMQTMKVKKIAPNAKAAWLLSSTNPLPPDVDNNGAGQETPACVAGAAAMYFVS